MYLKNISKVTMCLSVAFIVTMATAERYSIVSPSVIQPSQQRIGTLTFHGAGIDGSDVRVVFVSERFYNGKHRDASRVVPAREVLKTIVNSIEQRQLPINQMYIELKTHYFEEYDDAIQELLAQQKDANKVTYERISISIQ